MDLFPKNDVQELFGIKDIFKEDKKTAVQKPQQPSAKACESGEFKSIKYTKDEAINAMQALAERVKACKGCRLYPTRLNTVFGEGDIETKLMFVGEGPGETEDKTGRPFVGKAGQLLTKMIAAMGYEREKVYIANIVKCRPPENRNPFEDEAAACIDYLKQQIDIIKPEVIVCLGSVAVNYLLKNQTPITRLRGNWQSYMGYKVMPTYHPSYLLRSPNKKGEVWLDLQKVMAELGQKV